ncbi:ABC transporter permease [Alkalihalobacillus hemicellulosilyticus]|uniref:ABC transporter n=1 Tax=Halalkalibacter hemicellulosilyticusJCM 9152 TaxID=1236971 RepID=W4QD78_9BACI|nr:FtsX-like permease family protein [Halalkalibacter hemicellulosilyticus]GAE29638.1 ABC transporter [Halalkalibacter hemicellulosilyticusJCM 9152]
MNFFKRGLLSITRKKGKSLILLAIIFILGNLIAGGISIQQATNNVEQTIKERLGTSATLQPDHEAINQMSEEEWMDFEYPTVSLDLIQQVGQLSYVKYYDYSISTYLGSDSLDSYQGDTDMYEGHGMEFRLKGTNYAPVMDFEEGDAQLVDGRVFNDEEVTNGAPVAIISKNLAEHNQVTVGDTIVLKNIIFDYESGDEEEYASRDTALEVIGLFEPLSSVEEGEDSNQDRGMWDFMDMEAQNTVYVPNGVVGEEFEFQIEKNIELYPEDAMFYEDGFDSYYTPRYVLHSVDDVEAFSEEVQPLLPDMYLVRSAVDQYDNIAGPIQSMSKQSNYVLIASIIASVLIIGLVVLLFLRDRKRELGIYLSLGESRGRVLGQVLIEVMLIALIGIALSLFSGNLLASSVSDTLIANDEQSQGFDDFYYYDEFETNVSSNDVLDSYEVQLSTTYIVWFLVVGLLTVLLSTVIPLLYIVRLNPKKILM